MEFNCEVKDKETRTKKQGQGQGNEVGMEENWYKWWLGDNIGFISGIISTVWGFAFFYDDLNLKFDNDFFVWIFFNSF